MTVLLAAGCGATSNSTQPAQTYPAQHSQTPRPVTSATTRATVTTPATAATPGSTCAPGAIGPESASFISPADGWLLGVTMQDCWPSNSARIVLRKTTDGGRHWTPIAAPPAPWAGLPYGDSSAKSVGEVYFADARDGWAFAPGLWATHDGGATWRRVDTGGRSVYSLAATNGHVIAAFLNCGSEACGRSSAPSFSIETSPAGEDAWRPVPGGAGLGLPVVTAAGGTAYALGAAGAAPKGPGPNDFRTPAMLLSGSADGTAPWHRRATPCVFGAAYTVTAVTANSLLMACGLLGGHPTTNHLYRSADSGAHWRQFAYVGLYDGADAVAATPDGKLFVDGIVSGLEVSRDGGRNWLRPATLADPPSQVGDGGLIEFAMTTNNDGYLVARYGPLWLTGDGGLTWSPVTVR